MLKLRVVCLTPLQRSHAHFNKKAGLVSQVSGYILQTAQSWTNAGVTEDGHCQGACRPQCFFFTSQIETEPTLS